MSDDILTLPPPPADSRVAYGSDPNQFIDLRFPSAQHAGAIKSTCPLVLNIHGGFWRARYNLDHAGHLCAALSAQGLITANVEYRRVGNSGGGWPGTFADIRSALTFLRQNAQRYTVDAQKILVIGHSAGGQLALSLAAHEPIVTRVISLAGVVDLERAYQLHLSNDAVVEFLGGKPGEVPDHYREADPIRLSIRAQQWLICGSADDIVPPAFSRDYVAAKQKRPGGSEKGAEKGSEKEDAQLIEVPGAGHFDLIDPRSAAWKTVARTVLQSFS
jgi:acetyl esterase/lipase